MSWTATITETNKRDLDFEITVEFTNGTKINTVSFIVSEPDSIKKILKDQINQYEKIENLDVDSIKGKIDLSEPTIEPFVSPVLTDEEKIRSLELAFTNLVSDMKNVQKAFDLGLVSDVELDKAKQALKDSYKPEFIGYL